MSNRTKKITADTPAVTAETLVPTGSASDADAMIAELRQALAQKDEQINDLKSKRPSTPRAPRAPKAPPTIESVVEKQAKNPPKWMGLGGAAQVEARTAVGQDEATAIHEVAVEFENVLSQLMVFRHSTPELDSQTLMLTAWEFYNQVYGQAKPKTNPHPFQKKSASNGSEPEDSSSEPEQSALEEVLN